jgi:hypothetical protein
MKAGEERRRRADEYLAGRLSSIFPERARQTLGYARENAAALASDLLSAVESGAEEAKAKIARGEKQAVRFLQFSYLLSAAQRGELTLKIDCHDGRRYGDLAEIDAYWDYGGLFPYVDEDVAAISQDLKKTFTGFIGYEAPDIRQCYHVWIFMLMRDVMRGLVSREEFSRVLADVRGPGLAILYGAYLDQTEELRFIGRR